MSPPFILFGPAHLTALALAVLFPLAAGAVTRVCPSGDRWVRWFLAILLLGEWSAFYLVFWQHGWLDLHNGLPLSLCDWAEGVLIVALLSRNQFAYELGYFWGLSGSLQALITPDLAYGFPDMRFLIFMADHAGIIASLLYLTFGTRLRPTLASLPRVIAASLVYPLVAGAADYALGANYGYLHDKGGHVSLLTLLAPWPWYIGELVLIGLLSIAVYYAPFFLLDAFKRPKTSTS
ncbi:MAG TPA: TIGR02206 family membrane protein [Rhizomicrobium sp.]|nr:TIGR02206 family membrane protein [Rhizomicrobium sp.]